LAKASNVIRFAALGTTDHGESGTEFRADYLKPSGAIGFYHPDWVVAQRSGSGEVRWVIETKGRAWESTAAKDAAIRHWCEQVTALTGGA
jgi:type III restriction enzyme